MKKTLLVATILGASIISTGAQAADNWPYWYVGLSAGATYAKDVDYTSNGTNGNFEFDTGTQYGVNVGYIIPEDATLGANSSGRNRIELEATRREQDFDGVGATGDIKTEVVAANYYYDFNIDSSVMPYLGAGLGVARVEANAVNAAGANGRDNVGIYQFMAGLSYAPEYVPRTELVAGYKYLGTMDDPNVDNTGVGRTDIEYDAHSLEVGARFRF